MTSIRNMGQLMERCDGHEGDGKGIRQGVTTFNRYDSPKGGVISER